MYKNALYTNFNRVENNMNEFSCDKFKFKMYYHLYSDFNKADFINRSKSSITIRLQLKLFTKYIIILFKYIIINITLVTSSQQILGFIWTAFIQ